MLAVFLLFLAAMPVAQVVWSIRNQGTSTPVMPDGLEPFGERP